MTMTDSNKEQITQLDLPTLNGEIQNSLQNMMIFCDDEPEDNPPLQRTVQMVGDNIPVMLIAGINASGKSIMASVAATAAKKCGFGKRVVSMTNRTTSGFERAMVFGDESDSSTGVNSVSAVLMGLRSCKQDDSPSVLVLDEPDIGLSEEYAGALGEYIAQQMIEPDHQLKLIVVISHSRPLYRRLLEVLPYQPNTVFLGDKTRTFMDWLNGPVPHFGPEEIEKLKTRGLETWRAIRHVTGAK
jgi:hypothetical protein